ncbi:MAG: hypothetical protein ACXW4O_07595 [Candidatus Binatia bacterium]
MNPRTNVDTAGAKKAVVGLLSGPSKKARFATELVAGLRRFNVGKEEMDRALAELEAEGTVVVRDHFCADPHLAEVDLRVISLVETERGDDGHVAALHEIDLAWNKWLGEYLANHRCG